MNHPLSLPSDLDGIDTWEEETPFHDGMGGCIPDFPGDLADFVPALVHGLEKGEPFIHIYFVDNTRIKFELKSCHPLLKLTQTIIDPKSDIWDEKHRILLNVKTIPIFVEWLKKLEGEQGEKWPDYQVEEY